MPGDPVAAYLAASGIHNPTEEQYLQIKHQLGFDLPILLQYFKFLGDLFTGSKSWISFYPSSGENVFSIVGGETLDFIIFLIAPLLLGLFFGIILGKISSRKRYSRLDKAIQIFCILGLSLPIFFFGMLLQFFICHEAGLCNPTGNYQLAFFPFTFTVVTLITWQTRSYIIKNSYEKSLVYNTINTGIIFGFIFLFYMLIDSTFYLSGLGNLLLSSISIYNYYVIAAVLFIIIILFIITIIISNIIFSIRKFTPVKTTNSNFEPIIHNDLEKEQESIIKIKKDDVKKYILKRLKSPIFILGSLCLIFFIFIAIFPRVLTEYSLQEAITSLPGPWNGLDVLALIIWGIRDALLVGFGAVLIGLGGSLLFGFLIWISNYIKSRVESNILLTLFCMLIYITIIGLIVLLFTAPILGITSFDFSLNIGLIFGVTIGLIYFIRSRVTSSNDSTTFFTKVDRVILGLMTIFYIFPGVVLVILFIIVNIAVFGMFGLNQWGIFYYLGILLIPGFTLAITKGISREINLSKLVKSIITYIPLGIAFSLIIYFAIGFLGFSFPSSWNINLGSMFGIAQAYPDIAPWGWIWSGITISAILFSFFLFHIGLQEKKKKIRF